MRGLIESTCCQEKSSGLHVPCSLCEIVESKCRRHWFINRGVGLNPTDDTMPTSIAHGEHTDKLHRLYNIYGHSSAF